ncbi:MAG: PAS domain S-box protein, partial [Anaerolineales bacterium]|nr:PAS domain S-box protein [Anaerolineales bacterium]
LLDAGGKTTGVIEFVKDITKWVQAEQELELLLNLSRQASAETELDDLLFFIANKIVDVIPPAEAASIFFYDKKRKAIKVQAWAGFLETEIKGLEFSIEDSQVSKIFRTKKPTLIKDVSESPSFESKDGPNIKKIKSQIAVPLIFNKQVVGIIFADNLTRTDAFSQKNLDLLESIGNQLAGVIKSARLLDQMTENLKLLRQSEKRLLYAEQAGHLGFVEWNLGKNTSFLSDEACRIHGIDPRENLTSHDHIMKMIHPDDRAFVQENIDSLMRDGEKINLDHRIILPDGEVRWLNKQVETISEKDNEAQIIQGVLLDITKHKRVEENLKISEERFRTFMDNIPAMAYIKDSDLRHVYGNPASIAAGGFQALEEYLNTKAKDVLPDEIAREVEVNDKRVLKEKCIIRQEYTRILDDGKEQTILNIKFPIRGNQVGGLAIDITEGKQAQKTILQERNKAQKYLDIAEVMIVALNKEGGITLVNKKGAGILGYQIEELIGKNWFNTCILKSYRKQAHKVFDDFIAG